MEKIEIKDLTTDETILHNLFARKLEEGYLSPYANLEAKGQYSVEEALFCSLDNLGKVDIEYISSLSGLGLEEVIDSLKGKIFQNPENFQHKFYLGYELASAYLSGNLLEKLKIAESYNEAYPGLFKDNIKALKESLPSRISYKDIYVSLGSPWLPDDIVVAFISYLIGRYPSNWFLHDKRSASYELKVTHTYNFKATVTYGTNYINALEIIEKSLNNEDILIKRKTCLKGEWKMAIDENSTLMAFEKQRIILEEFNKWVFQDEARRERLEWLYYEKFLSRKKRVYNGDYLTFPELSRSVHLFPYQKDAVDRILQSKNVLLAHEVGSGKTYEMIASGMKLRQMGLAHKIMYVVPNPILKQWEEIFLKMYPKANVYAVSPKDFGPGKRMDSLAKIRDNDFDAIIIPYSSFFLIPLSKQAQLDYLNEEIAYYNEGKTQKTKVHQRKVEILEKRRSKVYAIPTDSIPEITFSDLGIDRLYVDESHNFKNLPLESASTSLPFNNEGSAKCYDLLLKMRDVQARNNGGGVVFATGTPITNSISDCYAIQKYLQADSLKKLDLYSFDGWLSSFAKKEKEFEVDLDTSNFRLNSRFSKFYNLPELSLLLSEVASFHKIDKSEDLPEFAGYEDILCKKGNDLPIFLKEISTRADRIRSGKPMEKENNEGKLTKDNMLWITSDGKKAALDIRLVSSKIPFDYEDSKLKALTDNVSRIYFEQEEKRSSQLIFLDTSTPKSGFNLYDEIKKKLVEDGVKANEIAFIHDATQEKERSLLFHRVNKGTVRVLIGSTPKLGTGVNVQERLFAIHHLDVPWRPSDMVQREGRILRPGNSSQQIHIYRYIKQDSFDAYSWQLLEVKQSFISKLLDASIKQRYGEDVDESVLDYGEVKSLAIANPKLKDRVETYNELQRYKTLEAKRLEERSELKTKYLLSKQNMTNFISQIADLEKDITSLESSQQSYSTSYLKAHDEILLNALEEAYLKVRGEKYLFTYFGFQVKVPSYVSSKYPYVYLEQNGRYHFSLPRKSKFLLERIKDQLLDFLKQKLTETKKEYSSNNRFMLLSRNELKIENSYQEKIDEYQAKLDALDAELGIKG